MTKAELIAMLETYVERSRVGSRCSNDQMYGYYSGRTDAFVHALNLVRMLVPETSEVRPLEVVR